VAAVELTLDEAISSFPNLGIFSANQESFLAFDRGSRSWKRVRYDEIKEAERPDGGEQHQNHDHRRQGPPQQPR
jgi:hypothetical protein